MGFFNKRPKKEKVYSIKESIPDDKADVHIKTIRQKRNDFIEGLSIGEESKNLEYAFRESSKVKREYTNYER